MFFTLRQKKVALMRMLSEHYVTATYSYINQPDTIHYTLSCIVKHFISEQVGTVTTMHISVREICF
jgi:hypothetical protein